MRPVDVPPVPAAEPYPEPGPEATAAPSLRRVAEPVRCRVCGQLRSAPCSFSRCPVDPLEVEASDLHPILLFMGPKP